MQHTGRKTKNKGEKIAERETGRKKKRGAHRDQIGRMNDGKMMREMRGIWGGSRKAALDPLKTKTLIMTLHGKHQSLSFSWLTLIGLKKSQMADEDGEMAKLRWKSSFFFLRTEKTDPQTRTLRKCSTLFLEVFSIVLFSFIKYSSWLDIMI